MKTSAESQDEVGSLARGALAMELLQPVVDSRKGDKIMIDGHAMQKIDFVERVQRGTVVVQERWRREFESELQARIPAVSRLRVMVPSVIADHNINIEIIDMSEWAVRARCGR